MCQKIFLQSRKHLAERRIAEAVESLVAGLAGLDNVLIAEDGQVLGGIRLLDSDLLAELTDGHFAQVEALDDGDSGRVREGLEDLRLELPH